LRNSHPAALKTQRSTKVTGAVTSAILAAALLVLLELSECPKAMAPRTNEGLVTIVAQHLSCGVESSSSYIGSTFVCGMMRS